MQLLFICTGNICRSPFAEVLARKVAGELGMTGLEVISAGTHAMVGYGCPEDAVTVGRTFGVELSTHRPTQVTPELIRASDLVLVMEPAHAAYIRSLSPDYPANRVRELVRYTQGSQRPSFVPDPFGGQEWAYRASYRFIETLVRALLDGVRRGVY
jgi:protein-tyrosine-phosphatase